MAIWGLSVQRVALSEVWQFAKSELALMISRPLFSTSCETSEETLPELFRGWQMFRHEQLAT